MAGQLERHRHKYNSGRCGKDQSMGLICVDFDYVMNQMTIPQYHLHVQYCDYRSHLMYPQTILTELVLFDLWILSVI